MCLFLKAVGFNHPLLFTCHKTRQRTPLLLLRNGEAHDQQYLHIFISSMNFYNHFLAPGVEINGGEVRSAPKEATRATRRCPWATTSPRSPAKEEMKVWSNSSPARLPAVQIANITVLCVDQCGMAPISAHSYISLILINRLDCGSKKKKKTFIRE